MTVPQLLAEVETVPEALQLHFFADRLTAALKIDRTADQQFALLAERTGLAERDPVGVEAILEAAVKRADDERAERTSRPPPLIETSSQFIGGFIPPDYLLDGILQRRFIYSLTGRTGSGKTAVLLLITASVALNRSIGAHDVQQGRVLYFAGENPDDIRMRWIAMAPHLDFDVETIPVSFIAGTFKISEMKARIESEAKAAGPFALVAVDTSAAYFEGDDENSNAQQGAHARRLRSLISIEGAPCVIVGCHPTKNAGDDNLSPRGGGAFIAEMDGNLTATKDDGSVELHWQGKFRGPDFAPISFALRTITHQHLVDTKGRPIPTVMASHLSDAAKEEITAAARSNENRLLAVLAEDGGNSLADLARRLGWLLRSGEPHKMMVKRAREKLIKAKLITMERDRAVLSDKGRKVLEGVVTVNDDASAVYDSSYHVTNGRYDK